MGKNFYIVDRFEGQSIVLEGYDEDIIIIDRSMVTSMPLEGDILLKGKDVYSVDKEETEKRKKNIEQIMKGMWEEQYE